MKVLIIGGGIGGLTTAIALQQQNIACEIFDAAPCNKPLGAGIMLGANAMKVYHRLGIADALSGHGVQFQKMNIMTYKGSVLQTIENEILEKKYGAATYAIHRAALQQQLINAAPVPVQWGKRFVNAVQNKNSVTAYFEDGSTATGDLLIGADGIRSVVREKHVANARYRYSGQTCWRATVALTLPEAERAVTSEIWGPGNGLRAMYTQVGPQQVYFWMTKCMPAGTARTPEAALQLIRSELRDFPGYMQILLQHLQPDTLIHSDLYDIAPLHQWVNGRIVLLGDAAHATTPNLGQGAGQAIEDAYVLARCLSKEQDIKLALEKYCNLRMKRVHGLVNMAWNLARATNLSNPLLVALRNGLMKCTPRAITEKQMDFIFGVQLD